MLLFYIIFIITLLKLYTFILLGLTLANLQSPFTERRTCNNCRGGRRLGALAEDFEHRWNWPQDWRLSGESKMKPEILANQELQLQAQVEIQVGCSSWPHTGEDGVEIKYRNRYPERRWAVSRFSVCIFTKGKEIWNCNEEKKQRRRKIYSQSWML